MQLHNRMSARALRAFMRYRRIQATGDAVLVCTAIWLWGFLAVIVASTLIPLAVHVLRYRLASCPEWQRAAITALSELRHDRAVIQQATPLDAILILGLPVEAIRMMFMPTTLDRAGNTIGVIARAYGGIVYVVGPKQGMEPGDSLATCLTWAPHGDGMLSRAPIDDPPETPQNLRHES